MILTAGDLFFLCFCLGVHLICRYHRRIALPTPPGLPKWPILGSALYMPLTYLHIFYKDLGKRLGAKMMYMEAVGTPLLVINDYRIAQDLLEKRSALYSSRPRLIMLQDIAKITHFFSTMPYGDEWRSHRRLFQQYFSTKSLPRDQEKLLSFVRKGLLPYLYKSPEDFRDHLRNTIGGFAVSSTYGLPVQRQHDPFIREAEEGFTFATTIATPSTYLVNIIPQLQYIPEWVPGTKFKRVAQQVRTQLVELTEKPFRTTITAIDIGKALPSFVSELLERYRGVPDSELQVRHIKQAAAQIYGAVSETTVAVVLTFIMAMANHLHFQRRAQEEIDSVIEHDRLPDFSDLHHLPYLSAIVKEVLRWNPVIPIGLAHVTTEEDVYERYYVPKDCIVLGNTYAMLHDDEIFPNPTKFNPERFIRDGVLRDDIFDPETMATFGFGRRRCPGAHIGLSAVYISIASILHLFDITPEIDQNGNPIQIEPRFAESAVSIPDPFKCKIIPRENRNLDVLLSEYFGTEPI